MDEADLLLTYGTPDRIEPTEGSLHLETGDLPFQRVFTYRGTPLGAAPADGEVEGPDETIEDTVSDRPQMARWRVYVHEGRVVARQLSFRGDFARASFPGITRQLPTDLVSRPHGESAGPVANTRHLNLDDLSPQVSHQHIGNRPCLSGPTGNHLDACEWTTWVSHNWSALRRCMTPYGIV